MTETVSRLVRPLTRDEFFRHYWTQQHLHIQRPEKDAYADIAGVEDIDRFLQSERTSAAFFNVVSAAERIGIEKWSKTVASERGSDLVAIPERLLDLYAAGSTLILNQADRAIPAIGNLVRNLASELGMRTSANIYITPPNSHGFAKHGDDHEVFVLQLSGSKTWKIHHSDGREEEADMREGDGLYIPRGLEHSARCAHAPSVHITIGILPWYNFRIVEQLAEIAKQRPAFSRAAPPAFASADEKQQYELGLPGILDELIRSVTAPQLMDGLSRDLVVHQAQGWPGRFLDFLQLEKIQAATRVRMREGIIPRVEREASQFSVSFASRLLKVPVFLEATLQQVMSGEPFEIGSLKGMLTAQGKVELAKSFIREGLLTIVSR